MLAQKNSRKQGDVGMGSAIGWFSSQGWTVCIPLTDSQEYDLVVGDKGGKLYKVQVKTTTHKTRHSTYAVQLCVKGGNRSGTGKVKRFDSTEVDFVFVLTEEGTKYLVPATAISDNGVSMNLGSKYEEFKI